MFESWFWYFSVFLSYASYFIFLTLKFFIHKKCMSIWLLGFIRKYFLTINSWQSGQDDFPRMYIYACHFPMISRFLTCLKGIIKKPGLPNSLNYCPTLASPVCSNHSIAFSLPRWHTTHIPTQMVSLYCFLCWQCFSFWFSLHMAVSHSWFSPNDTFRKAFPAHLMWSNCLPQPVNTLIEF